MDEAADKIVGKERAPLTAFGPVGIEHKMIDDELGMILEKVTQAGRTLRTFENILLLDLDHGELAALGAELVTPTGELLLSCKQLFSRRQPLSLRHDVRMIHIGLLSSLATRFRLILFALVLL